MLILRNDTLAELLQLTLNALPHEAVGLLDGNGKVYPLPNHHGAESAFEIHKADLLSVIEENPHVVLTELTLWHSHPAGGVGPSRVDLQNKTPFKYHLVVSLIDGDITPTWY